jgi:hypothetical protein
MMKSRRNVIGTRVDNETDEALKRLAAARSETYSGLCSQILTEYVARLQTTGTTGVFDEVSQQFDERLAEHGRRQMREIEAALKPIKKEQVVLKAQLDVIAEFIAPERRNEYRDLVAKLIQTMGIQANGVRP